MSWICCKQKLFYYIERIKIIRIYRNYCAAFGWTIMANVKEKNNNFLDRLIISRNLVNLVIL